MEKFTFMLKTTAVCLGTAIVFILIFSGFPRITRESIPKVELATIVMAEYKEGKLDLNVGPTGSGNLEMPLTDNQSMTLSRKPDEYYVLVEWKHPTEGQDRTYRLVGKQLFANMKDHIGELVEVSCTKTFNVRTQRGEEKVKEFLNISCDRAWFPGERIEHKGE